MHVYICTCMYIVLCTFVQTHVYILYVYKCVITSSVMNVLHEEVVVLFDEMDLVSMII